MKNKRRIPTLPLICWFTITFLFSCKHNNIALNQNENTKAIIWLKLSSNLVNPDRSNYILKDNMELGYLPITNINEDSPWQKIFALASNGNIKWTFYIAKPVKISYGFGMLPLVNPGDSIVINYDGETYTYSGKGFHKLACWNKIKAVASLLERPTFSNNYIKSLQDYLQWHKYVNEKLSMQVSILEAYKNKISAIEYDYLKTMMVNSAESDRIQTFQTLQLNSKKDSVLCIKPPDLMAIWDSTQYHPLNNWLHTVSDFYGNIRSIKDFNRAEVWRQYNFDQNNDSLKSKVLSNYLYYSHAKKKYRGLLRERLLAGIIEDQSKKAFNDPITQLMLKDYFSQPGFPEIKNQMRELEQKAQKLAKK